MPDCQSGRPKDRTSRAEDAARWEKDSRAEASGARGGESSAVIRLPSDVGWMCIIIPSLMWAGVVKRNVRRCLAEDLAMVTPTNIVSLLRPQLRREYPLNLSISLSGGKENNYDFPSKGD